MLFLSGNSSSHPPALVLLPTAVVDSNDISQSHRKERLHLLHFSAAVSGFSRPFLSFCARTECLVLQVRSPQALEQGYSHWMSDSQGLLGHTRTSDFFSLSFWKDKPHFTEQCVSGFSQCPALPFMWSHPSSHFHLPCCSLQVYPIFLNSFPNLHYCVYPPWFHLRQKFWSIFFCARKIRIINAINLPHQPSRDTRVTTTPQNFPKYTLCSSPDISCTILLIPVFCSLTNLVTMSNTL